MRPGTGPVAVPVRDPDGYTVAVGVITTTRRLAALRTAAAGGARDLAPRSGNRSAPRTRRPVTRASLGPTWPKSGGTASDRLPQPPFRATGTHQSKIGSASNPRKVPLSRREVRLNGRPRRCGHMIKVAPDCRRTSHGVPEAMVATRPEGPLPTEMKKGSHTETKAKATHFALCAILRGDQHRDIETGDRSSSSP